MYYYYLFNNLVLIILKFVSLHGNIYQAFYHLEIILVLYHFVFKACWFFFFFLNKHCMEN